MECRINDYIYQEMINRTTLHENGLAEIRAKSGERIMIYCGKNIKDFPAKLYQLAYDFYKQIYDEIFDELHPY